MSKKIKSMQEIGLLVKERADKLRIENPTWREIEVRIEARKQIDAEIAQEDNTPD
jgi:hypothetical protein